MGVFRDAMDEAMVLRGLAPRTREAYLHWVGRLVRFCRVAPDRLTTREEHPPSTGRFVPPVCLQPHHGL